MRAEKRRYRNEKKHVLWVWRKCGNAYERGVVGPKVWQYAKSTKPAVRQWKRAVRKDI